MLLTTHAYELGYLVGTLLAAVVLAYVLRLVWFGFRGRQESDRWQKAFAAANSWKTFGVAGFLLLARFIGELGQ